MADKPWAGLPCCSCPAQGNQWPEPHALSANEREAMTRLHQLTRAVYKTKNERILNAKRCFEMVCNHWSFLSTRDNGRFRQVVHDKIHELYEKCDCDFMLHYHRRLFADEPITMRT
jgi:hypothetical protein